MKLVIISHKECWHKEGSAKGYVTLGGFPTQIRAIAELFDRTRLLVPVRDGAPPPGVEEIAGPGLSVEPLEALPHTLARRGLYSPLWLLRNGGRLWRALGTADAVHAIIPGDVGTFGFLCALVRRKRLFVRHCGEWHRRSTLRQRLWVDLMERSASSQRIMFATGSGAGPPSRRNPAIAWIFATSISDSELAGFAARRQADFGQAPRLVIACRQNPQKGTQIVIESLVFVLKSYPEATLKVVGDGAALPSAKQRARDLGIGDRVHFHGQVSRAEVMGLFSESDLFCYPVRTEGFPKIVVEALSCGLPIVATAVSVLPDLLNRGGGVVIAERTPHALARAVCACLDDQARYEEMSARAVATASCYTLERWQAQIRASLETAWGPLRDYA